MLNLYTLNHEIKKKPRTEVQGYILDYNSQRIIITRDYILFTNWNYNLLIYIYIHLNTVVFQIISYEQIRLLKFIKDRY